MSTFKKIIIAIGLIVFIWIFAIPFFQVQGIDIPKSGDPIPSTSYMRESSTKTPHQNQVWVELNQLSPHLLCAIVKAEDRNLFRHKGFDWAQIQKAFGYLINGDGPSMGGSTITQQLARNLFLSPKRSWIRKFREAIYTVFIEFRLTKEEILAMYVNSIEWGSNIWGVNQSSMHYFAKPPHELNLYQALFLASMIANPTTDQGKQIPRIERVYRRISHQLLYSGYITPLDYENSTLCASNFSQYMMTQTNMEEALKAYDKPFEAGQDISITHAIADECGLDKEYANTDKARRGEPLDIRLN